MVACSTAWLRLKAARKGASSSPIWAPFGRLRVSLTDSIIRCRSLEACGANLLGSGVLDPTTGVTGCCVTAVRGSSHVEELRRDRLWSGGSCPCAHCPGHREGCGLQACPGTATDSLPAGLRGRFAWPRVRRRSRSSPLAGGTPAPDRSAPWRRVRDRGRRQEPPPALVRLG
jgi:hypothetical protein